jgi:hypothetical protein
MNISHNNYNMNHICAYLNYKQIIERNVAFLI